MVLHAFPHQLCLKPYSFFDCPLFWISYWISNRHTGSVFNPLNASVALIYKPVKWFAQQINWLVSIRGQHWYLMGYQFNNSISLCVKILLILMLKFIWSIKCSVLFVPVIKFEKIFKLEIWVQEIWLQEKKYLLIFLLPAPPPLIRNYLGSD